MIFAFCGMAALSPYVSSTFLCLRAITPLISPHSNTQQFPRLRCFGISSEAKLLSSAGESFGSLGLDSKHARQIVPSTFKAAVFGFP